ncbi:OmpA family protein [Reichenbachiella ulvae]|uniref:OmpA family protein n=1 Tax=Reichenbachiella ulvae TaxID=2980104 RepID=A0ABT3CYC5_9BACT|nr:OmpA family protein [Reichenbachiella ulvae]MCV9388698.1 OmpA family protein [Reichenbachiella ulvae]
MRGIAILIGCLLGSQIGFSQIEVFSDQLSVGDSLNSPFDESTVILSPDESQLYFTRKNHPENVGGVDDPGDVWYSEHQIDGTWSDPENLKSVNTPGLNQMVGFLDIERRILVQTDTGLKSYYRVSGRWFDSDPVEVEYLKNQGEHFSATISDNAKIMLIAMESFGTYGVEDLYVSQLQPNGKWSSPKNLGGTLNTPHQEITPFLAADNKTLFFSSNGRGGQGSFDVFMSTRLDDTWLNWSEPKNLGPRVNTSGWESSFVLPTEKEFAFLISTQNSEGYGDIKMVRVAQEIEKLEEEIVEEEPVAEVVQKKFVPIHGEVRDQVTRRVIVGAEVEAVIFPSGEKKKARTNRMGQFTLNVTDGERYNVKARAFQYMTAEIELSAVEAASGESYTFELNPVIEGNTVALDNVLFKRGQSELIEGSEKELDLVVEMMKYNPDISIFLSGHTDNQGDAKLNLKLSEERVKTVNRYLVSHGIAEERINGKGYGGTKPRASNASPESRKLNRRVEFTIQKKD